MILDSLIFIIQSHHRTQIFAGLRQEQRIDEKSLIGHYKLLFVTSHQECIYIIPQKNTPFKVMQPMVSKDFTKDA